MATTTCYLSISDYMALFPLLFLSFFEYSVRYITKSSDYRENKRLIELPDKIKLHFHICSPPIYKEVLTKEGGLNLRKRYIIIKRACTLLEEANNFIL